MTTQSEDQFEAVCKDLEEKDHLAALAHEKGEQAMRYWSISRQIALTLSVIISHHRPQTILELGTSAGYSTIWFAHTAQQYGGKVYTMERDPLKIPLAQDTFARVGLTSHITLMEGEIRDLLQTWDKKIDFLFIDANKKKYLTYLKQLEPFFVSGTIIAADNIINRADMLQDYVDYVTTSPLYTSTLLSVDTGVMISVKK